MYCSQCGKKVMDNMLFCPFCGSPIVIPEQEEHTPAIPPKKQEAMSEAAEKSAEAEVQEEMPEEELPEEELPEEEEIEEEEIEEEAPVHWSDRAEPLNFEPLDLDNLEEGLAKSGFSDEELIPLNLDEIEEEEEERDISDEVSELLYAQISEEPVPQKKKPQPKPKPQQKPAMDRRPADPGRKAKSMVSMKSFDPDDIFMDGNGHHDDYDDYEDDAFEYEEPERGSFLVRHIRGVVALSLFLVMAAVIAGWALSDSGQLSLAQANLAWRPAAYERLGYDAYQAGNYVASGSYYEKALSKDEDNFGYAYSAGVAYYAANRIEDSAEMGKKTIAIDKSRPEGYELLLRLYPDASARPWEITALIQQGYRETGNQSFNIGE